MEALAEVEELTLSIAGDGPEADALQDLARKLEVDRRVHFLGRIEHGEVATLVARHGAVVAPSLWMDNSPLTIHEALTAGRPVLGSLRGGIPELVEDGRTGFLFEPNDRASIVRALQRYRELAATDHADIARQAAARAASFDPAAFLNALLDTYRRAIAAEAVR